MKHLFSFFTAITLLACTMSAQAVTFKFEDGTLRNDSIRPIMEERISNLLTEISLASEENRPLCLDSLHLTPKAAQRLGMLWNNIHFSCDYSANVEKCLRDVTGYEVHGILVTLQPTKTDTSLNKNRELSIYFTSDGLITDVNIAMENFTYQDAIANTVNLTDTRRRLEILKYIEDLHCQYDAKNMEGLQDIFDDKMFFQYERERREDKKLGQQIRTNYMENLAKVFEDQQFPKIIFSDITIRRHMAKPGFYCASLHHEWSPNECSQCNGYMLLIWEFREGHEPVFHIRAWQPEMVGNHKLTEDDLFTEYDFFLP